MYSEMKLLILSQEMQVMLRITTLLKIPFVKSCYGKVNAICAMCMPFQRYSIDTLRSRTRGTSNLGE